MYLKGKRKKIGLSISDKGEGGIGMGRTGRSRGCSSCASSPEPEGGVVVCRAADHVSRVSIPSMSSQRWKKHRGVRSYLFLGEKVVFEVEDP